MNIALTLALVALFALQVNTDAVASFRGKVKSADKKQLILAVEEGESLRMFVTPKTRWIRNGTAAKPAEFHPGDGVDVDAARDVRLNLLAVKVEFPAKPAEEAPK